MLLLGAGTEAEGQVWLLLAWHLVFGGLFGLVTVSKGSLNQRRLISSVVTGKGVTMNDEHTLESAMDKLKTSHGLFDFEGVVYFGGYGVYYGCRVS